MPGIVTSSFHLLALLLLGQYSQLIRLGVQPRHSTGLGLFNSVEGPLQAEGEKKERMRDYSGELVRETAKDIKTRE